MRWSSRSAVASHGEGGRLAIGEDSGEVLQLGEVERN
jgi:hypothetical protein